MVDLIFFVVIRVVVLIHLDIDLLWRIRNYFFLDIVALSLI